MQVMRLWVRPMHSAPKLHANCMAEYCHAPLRTCNSCVLPYPLIPRGRYQHAQQPQASGGDISASASVFSETLSTCRTATYHMHMHACLPSPDQASTKAPSSQVKVLVGDNSAAPSFAKPTPSTCRNGTYHISYMPSPVQASTKAASGQVNVLVGDIGSTVLCQTNTKHMQQCHLPHVPFPDQAST